MWVCRHLEMVMCSLAIDRKAVASVLKHDGSYDRSLADRLKQGDWSVLEDILEAYGAKVIAQLRKTISCLNAHDCDDVLQAAVVSLWKNADRYDGKKASVRAYFYVIARCRAIDLVRSKKRFNDLIQGVITNQPADHVAPPPEDFLEDSPHLTALKRVLNELSETDRVIILASTNGGFWTKNLANELGLPASTIRVRRYRIERKIRRMMLESQGFEDNE